MNDSKKTKTRFAGLGRAVWAVIAVWTGVIAASLTWNIVLVREEILDAARIQARVAYEKDIIYRRWNTRHGGVYVPVSKGTEQNPYLSDIPERDITTPSGKRLTLMNPAYMTRQVHELAEKEYGIRGHITSLNPIRPQNAADPWETRALRAFESGKMEISSVEEMDGNEYMRLMRPLITEKGCLRCHAAYGSQEGDIRGGISVSIPMEPLWAINHRRTLRLLLGHGFLWLLGLVAIVFVMQRLTRSEQERKQAEESLKRAFDELEKQVEERTSELTAANEELRAEAIERKQAEEALRFERDNLHNIFEAIEDGIYIVNRQYDIQYVNPVLVKDFGPYEGIKCYRYFHDRDEACPWCKNQDVLAGKTVHWEWYSSKNRKTYDLLDTPMTLPDGSTGKLEIFRDITKRKQAETELEKHQKHLETMVKERTNELEEKVTELEEMNDLFVGREIRINELKERVKELEESKEKLKNLGI